MKNFIIAALAFFTMNAVAQEKKVKPVAVNKTQQISVKDKSVESNANFETKRLTKQLGLTKEQQASVYNIILEHFKEELNNKQKIKKIASTKENTSKVEIKKTIKKYKEEASQRLDNKLKSVLTANQYKDYQQDKPQQQKTNQARLKKKN